MAFPYDVQGCALNNENFRDVIHTTTNQQLVVMSVSTDIPMEIHDNTDQFIYIIKGHAGVLTDNHYYELKSGQCVMVPKGVRHKISNLNNIPLKLFTLYSPPHHPQGLVER